jgi:hypothetical protein
MLNKPKKIDQIINKGGEVKSDKEGWAHFSLRIPNKTLQAIEAHLDTSVGQNKTNFILTAIKNELKRCHD